MIEIQFEQQQLPMNALRYLTVLCPNFFSVERQRISGEGGKERESDTEDESGTARIIGLQNQLEDVNNLLQLAEREKSQYASKCSDLEEQIKISEDIRKDLSKKCNDLEQHLILKERELSWNWKKDFEEMKSELEAKLENVNNRLELAESEKIQYASKYHDLEKQIESCEDQKNDLLKKYSHLEQHLNLKEREWSWKERNFRKTTGDLERQLVDVNNQLGRAESDKRQYSNTCNFLEKQNQELKSKLQCYEVEMNEQSNLNSPNPSRGKRASASEAREGGFEGKKHKLINLF